MIFVHNIIKNKPAKKFIFNVVKIHLNSMNFNLQAKTHINTEETERQRLLTIIILINNVAILIIRRKSYGWCLQFSKHLN